MNLEFYTNLKQELDSKGITLVAVSKTKPNELILELYNQGQRIFGENRVQELVTKHEHLPQDIQWHMIGHLQKNKVKYIAPFIKLIHSVDNFELAKRIHKEALKNERVIDILLQIKIASEETKSGFEFSHLENVLHQILALNAIRIRGVMGMGTFTDQVEITEKEFKLLNDSFKTLKQQHFSKTPSFDTISMGMSGDYKIAIECGSSMVRIGSLLFGAR